MRTLDLLAAYYAKRSKVWEAQALLRADPVVGDRELLGRFAELIDPLRYPPDGISATTSRGAAGQARVDEERLPRGADPHTHLKLGRGGLRRHRVDGAAAPDAVRRRRTRPAHLTHPRGLAAAREAGLVDEDDAAVLQQAWRRVSRVRNAVTLVRGKPSDELPWRHPRTGRGRRGPGYPPGSSDAMVNDQLRPARPARGRSSSGSSGDPEPRAGATGDCPRCPMRPTPSPRRGHLFAPPPSCSPSSTSGTPSAPRSSPPSRAPRRWPRPAADRCDLGYEEGGRTSRWT